MRYHRYAILIPFMILFAGCARSARVGTGPTPEPVTLRFAYAKDAASYYTPLLTDFQRENSRIRIEPIEVEQFGGGGMEQAVHFQDIDIYQDDRRALQDAKEGLLMPVGDLVEAQWSPIEEDYYAGTWEALSMQGQQWGVPAGMDLTVTYINKNHLTALNVEEPPAEWTVDDFLALTQKVNYPDGSAALTVPHLFGFCSLPQSTDPVLFVYLHGGRIVDDLNNPTEAVFDEPETVEAVQWYAELFSLYAVAPDPQTMRQSFSRGGIWEAAMRGTCGVWFQAYSLRGGFNERAKWDYDWTMRTLPKDQATFEAGDVSGYFITKKCQYPNEAATFLRYLSNRWEASGKQLPPRRSLAQGEDYLKALDKKVAAVAKVFSDQVIILPSEEQNNTLQQVGGLFVTAVQRVIVEEIDPLDALTEAQDQARPIFQEQ
jgi:ABC-type glycerol-3-phosphate transport system substrate-binding protein